MSKFADLIDAAREHLAERIETIKSDKHNFYSDDDLKSAEADRLLIEAQADELEQLQNAIRSGAGLGELARMIGPTHQELELAKARVAQMESLAEKCQWGRLPDTTAQRARDSWQRIANTQAEYENRYY